VFARLKDLCTSVSDPEACHPERSFRPRSADENTVEGPLQLIPEPKRIQGVLP
jgi:hypothetical protein